jgi:hypothetical protein
MLEKTGLGLILGDFFPIQSGHPDSEVASNRLCSMIDVLQTSIFGQQEAQVSLHFSHRPRPRYIESRVARWFTYEPKIQIWV